MTARFSRLGAALAPMLASLLLLSGCSNAGSSDVTVDNPTTASAIKIPGRTLPPTVAAVIDACAVPNPNPKAGHSYAHNPCPANAVHLVQPICDQLTQSLSMPSPAKASAAKDRTGPRIAVDISCDWERDVHDFAGFMIAAVLNQPYSLETCSSGTYATWQQCSSGNEGLYARQTGTTPFGVFDSENLDTENMMVNGGGDGTVPAVSIADGLQAFGFSSDVASIVNGAPYTYTDTASSTTSPAAPSYTPGVGQNPTTSSAITLSAPSAVGGNAAAPTRYTACGYVDGAAVWAGVGTQCEFATIIGTEFLNRLRLQSSTEDEIMTSFSVNGPLSHRPYKITCHGTGLWECTADPGPGLVYVGYGS